MSRIHELKCNPVPFNDLLSGQKRAEVRKDDRGFCEGDILRLREHIAVTPHTYTGREFTAEITHIQRGYGLPDGLVVLSIKKGESHE
ncbi:DUF3850 domain-containing protein [Cupriavidus sp. D39]|uniref:DUF3850 domain-containing protein n=1 Tax=Cupriavidus sp. D39 TaxID=2997877 RepID=UPI0022707BEA|nr:DUF3850 domain-containing protein [Cupriavidus sp. D39]MCY0854313.1 DUF3850 domain-containing protein [Cupriavidus sp. D39]